jgi:hypothetical protein
LAVAPGTLHTWWNDGHEEAHVLVEFRPALHFETILETGYGLARDGKTDDKGVPNPLQLGVMFNEYKDEIYLAALPIAAQKVLWALLGNIGKLLGYKARYPQYSGPEPEGEEATRPHSGSGGRTEAVAAGPQVERKIASPPNFRELPFRNCPKRVRATLRASIWSV